MTESLEKNVGLKTNKYEEIKEKIPQKMTEEKKEEKKKKTFLSRIAESMLYHPWGFPY